MADIAKLPQNTPRIILSTLGMPALEERYACLVVIGGLCFNDGALQIGRAGNDDEGACSTCGCRRSGGVVIMMTWAHPVRP